MKNLNIFLLFSLFFLSLCEWLMKSDHYLSPKLLSYLLFFIIVLILTLPKSVLILPSANFGLNRYFSLSSSLNETRYNVWLPSPLLLFAFFPPSPHSLHNSRWRLKMKFFSFFFFWLKYWSSDEKEKKRIMKEETEKLYSSKIIFSMGAFSYELNRR
jgi:hypothetical protein